VTALALFGIWITARATWVIVRGGDTSFDGAFNYPQWSAVHFVPALVFAAFCRSSCGQVHVAAIREYTGSPAVWRRSPLSCSA
jgi:hypothetical protein